MFFILLKAKATSPQMSDTCCELFFEEQFSLRASEDSEDANKANLQFVYYRRKSSRHCLHRTLSRAAHGSVWIRENSF